MKIVVLVVAIVIFILGCVFALLNAQVVTLNFLLGQVKWPLTVYLLIALCLGSIIGYIVGVMRRFSRRPSKSRRT